ncbi:hypothetical protein KCV01_g25492, partial [Aureobasidium melanogenum]
MGPLTGKASSLLIMAIVGGALIPWIQGVVADAIGVQHAFFIPLICYGYILFYGLSGSKIRNLPPQGGAGQPPAFVPFAGGAPANVAVAAARLGAQARFAGMLARDMFGDFLLKSLVDLDVGTDDIARTDEARTALAFVAHDDKGDRSFSFYRPPAADLLFRPEHFRKEAFDDLAVFHVCSNSLTEAAIADTTVEGMRRARAAGALVSFDMNLRPALWPKGEDQLPRLWNTLSEADVIKLSAEEFAVLHEGAGSDDAVLERLWKGHARLLLVTDGAEPMR